MLTPDAAQAPLLSSESAEFDDIRPCRDDEVQSELQKIIADKQVLSSILKFRYPILARHLSFILTPLLKKLLAARASKLHNVSDFQLQVASFMEHMMSSTTDGVEFVGFDRLDPQTGYLFISNHRDISLDPAFIDLALHLNKLDTVRIAIGDNLLKIPAATSLMRLNKSFVVRRSLTSPREKLAAFNHLSAYIGLSLKEGHSVWIAQREGRAKDGDDRTEDAVLKMISLYGKKQKIAFAPYMSSLNIVPVAITYEFDPNDLAKAHELQEREIHGGEYHKDELEDIDTITRGIREYKGRVRIVAGQPIKDGFEDAEGLAALIDSFIWENYTIYPPALISAGLDDQVKAEEREKFIHRLSQYPESLRERVKAMYAKPLENRRAAGIA